MTFSLRLWAFLLAAFLGTKEQFSLREIETRKRSNRLNYMRDASTCRRSLAILFSSKIQLVSTSTALYKAGLKEFTNLLRMLVTLSRVLVAWVLGSLIVTSPVCAKISLPSKIYGVNLGSWFVDPSTYPYFISSHGLYGSRLVLEAWMLPQGARRFPYKSCEAFCS